MIKRINEPHPPEFTDQFNKQLDNVPHEIKKAFRYVLELFIENPNDPALRNHQLTGKLANYRSIDITGLYRALFKEVRRGKQKIVRFHQIGSKPDLYRYASKQ